MPAPRVSVIMAVHNEERFISEAIESVLSQSFADLELIVSDDGSTDATLELAQRFSRRDPERVRVITDPVNRGKAFALNRALRVRRGDMIAWLDGDDVMLPGKLERQLSALEANPGAAGVTHDAEMFESGSGAVIGRFSQVANGAPLRSGGLEILFDPTYKMLPSATMIRAAHCPEHGFDERLRFTNDWLFDIEVFRGGSLVALDEVLVRYRRHDDNFTTRAAASGASLEEGLMAMAIVMARYPELQRAARTVSSAILLGQARRHASSRGWREAWRYASAAVATGGVTGLLGVGGAVLGSAMRSRRSRARSPRG